uniref:NADH-ubiquinone oxidoreductase chain 6 n=1 Tax=Conocephalus melaenus TaxID=948344 RepID=A0A1Q1MPG9_9ORTH|nr:NADH dehydrogenase subunit 6 [Conocephalus melaenus]AQM39990.1 NADH dehydrogenase subunit 6 [Conocephalus melaenus]
MLFMALTCCHFINSLFFPRVKHPLAMALLIIVQAVLICMITSLIKSTAWFSYSLFLVYLGGGLVFISLCTALASNEIFSLSSIEMMVVSTTFIYLMGMISVLDHYFQPTSNSDTLSINSNITLITSETTNLLTKLYDTDTMYTTLTLISYLLLTLFVVVKITNITGGPLRSLN